MRAAPHNCLPRHALDGLWTANGLHLQAEVFVGPHLGGHVQQHGEIARGFQAQAHLGVAGLAAEQALQSPARSRLPLRPSQTRIEITLGRSMRALSSGTMSCTEILGGAFSSGSTRPRTSTA